MKRNQPLATGHRKDAYALEVTRSKTSMVDRTTTQTLMWKNHERQRDGLCTRTDLPLNNIPNLLLMLDDFFVMCHLQFVEFVDLAL